MDINDKEYFSSIENVFDLLPSLFSSDVLLCLTDRERYILIKQAQMFKLNISEGMPIIKDGDSEKAMITRQKQSAYYKKEVVGHPAKAYSVPIVNKSTGNVLGTISFVLSQEKESNIIEMAAELNSFSEQLSSSAQEIASSAEELSATSQNMGAVADETKSGIRKMDDILGYITGVADTTNLLGLNAAIEAARAGEHGRGFSVVAQEIRKLASSSKSSVQEIGQTLTKVKNDINGILESINIFAGTSEQQTAHAQQLASNSERLSVLASELLKLTESLTN